MRIGPVPVRAAAHRTSQPPQPRFTLANLSVTVGAYADAAEHEKHLLTTVGSGSYQTTGEDEFRFSPRSGALRSVWLRVPEDTLDEGEWARSIAPASQDQPVEIVSERPVNFSAPTTSARCVGRAGRFLMCVTSHATGTATTSATWLTVASGLRLRFEHGHYVGWLLNNPERFLSAGWSAAPDAAHDKELARWLEEYFLIVRQPYIDMLEDGDERVLTELSTLRDRVDPRHGATQRRQTLLSTIEDLVDWFRG